MEKEAVEEVEEEVEEEEVEGREREVELSLDEGICAELMFPESPKKIDIIIYSKLLIKMIQQ